MTFAAFKNGRVAVKVVKTSSGACWGGALAVRRSDAWRCHSGKRIYDPCFARAADAHIVFCPTRMPWVRRAVELKLSSALPARFGNPRGSLTAGPPWALRTIDGKACIAATGLTKTIGGRAVAYTCSGGGGLVGTPQTTSKLWRIRYVRGSRSPQWLQVAVAWW